MFCSQSPSLRVCLHLAGKLNTISVTLAVNTLVTARHKFVITISGLKGAMWTTGLVELSSTSGHHTLFESSAESGAKIGFGYWDNMRKSLVVRVAGVLKEYQSYSFSFNVVNPPYGQPRPTIIMGSTYQSIGLSTCPPWARPLSSRVKLRIFNTSELMEPESDDPYYPRALTTVTYTLRSLEEGYSTVIHGCSVPGSDTEGILVPAGRWVMTMSSTGMFDLSLELRTSIAAQEDGDNRMVVAQGTACGSDKIRSIYQDCMWWDMPSTIIDVYMQQPVMSSARVVLLWGARPVDMDLSVQFKNIKYKRGTFAPLDGACEYGDILVGGGVYWGCRSQQLLYQTEDGFVQKESEVLFEKDAMDGFGPEVLYFWNVPDGEYHLTVKVYPSVDVSEREGIGDELLIGAEEVKVYLPGGTSKAVYSSVRASQAGMFWHVGYILVQDGSMSFRTLNRDQLTKDPETFKPGWKLSFHIEVFSAKDGAKLDRVTYECRSAGNLANAGDLLSKGNLPQTTFEIENQVYVELADLVSDGEASASDNSLARDFPEQEYIVRLSKPGYNDQDVFVSFSGRQFHVDKVAYMVPLDHMTYVVLNWQSRKDLDLWLFPCTNTGRWDFEATRCEEGEALAQGAVYWGCSQYSQRMLLPEPAPADTTPAPALLQGSLQTIIDNVDGSGPETLALEHMPVGFYDVWVHSYTEEPFEGDEQVSVRLASGDGRTHVSHKTEYITARRQAAPGPIWWHVGYINRTQVGDSEDFVTDFVPLNAYGSSPADSGCRIYRPQDSVAFAANSSGGGASLPSGISIAVAPGALARRSSAPALEMSVTQLLLPPVEPPTGVNARFAAPVIYLEPSGTTFGPPGVNVSMPVAPELSIESLQRAAVFRLEKGSWREIASSYTMLFKNDMSWIVECIGNTLTFSAYALIILDKPVIVATPTSAIIETTPPPREKSVDSLSAWWMLYIVFPLSGLVALSLIFVCCFRLRYKRFPFQKPMEETAIHPDFAPKKTSEANLRLKLLEQEAKSKDMYTESHELSRMGVLMQESIEAKLRDERDQVCV